MNVLIIPNFEKKNTVACTREICHELKRFDAEVLMQEKEKAFVNLPDVCYGSFEQQIGVSDVVIAIGGDGTIIHTAKRAVLYDKPVLGVNAGRLGFLAGLEQDEIPLLKKLVEQDYQIENRMMLEVEHHTAVGNQVYFALNDAVISKGALSKMVESKIYCMGRFVTSYRSDGIILSTPTGSTAYALSAGGPILEPSLDSISLTPISPHSLFDRTILFAPDNELLIQTDAEPDTEIYLTIDGEEGIRISPNDRLTVKKSSILVKMIRLQEKPFYEVLNQKLLTRAKNE